jgi:hypothetical protein
MEAADGDGVFVTELAAKRARLGIANVMCLARCPAAHDAGLGCDIIAVLLVAKPDCFGKYAATARRLLGQNDRGGR